MSLLQLDDSATLCLICEDSLEECEIVTLECNHTYHKVCIYEWYKYNVGKSTCPICRQKFTLLDDDNQRQDLCKHKSRIKNIYIPCICSGITHYDNYCFFHYKLKALHQEELKAIIDCDKTPTSNTTFRPTICFCTIV